MERKVILASASPRRLERMNKHGVEPLVMPTDADETITGGLILGYPDDGKLNRTPLERKGNPVTWIS